MFTRFFIRSYPMKQFFAIAVLSIALVLGYISKAPLFSIDLSFSFFDFFDAFTIGLVPLFFTLAFILLIIVGYRQKFVVGKEKVMPANSYLMLFLFVSISASFFKDLTINSEFLAFLFLAFAYSILLSSSQLIPSYIRYAEIGMLIGVASIFYAPSILFIIIVFIALSINNLFIWRAWVIPIIMIVISHIFCYTILLLAQGVGIVDYFQFYISQFSIRVFDFNSFSNSAVLYSLMLLLTYIISIFFLFSGLNKKLILIRKVFMLSFWTSLLMPLYGFYYLNHFSLVLLYWIFPVVLLFTNYFTFRKKKIYLREFLFVGLFCSGSFYLFY